MVETDRARMRPASKSFGEGIVSSALYEERAQLDRSQDPRVATDSAMPDTFPKLVRHHALSRGHRPAIRHKDRGIWKTWTWAEAYSKVRALAFSLKKLGLEPGGKIAIVGSNRPHLYWTMTAAQMLRAVPIP